MFQRMDNTKFRREVALEDNPKLSQKCQELQQKYIQQLRLNFRLYNPKGMFREEIQVRSAYKIDLQH